MRRQSLVCLLQSSPGFEITGEISNALEFTQISENLAPDLIITDLNLPSNTDTDSIHLINKWNPRQRILVLSDNLSPIVAVRTLRNGANGYVVRVETAEVLFEGIRAVHHGKRYVSSSIRDQIIDAVVAGKAFDNSGDEKISSREREILNLIAQGKSNSEIGRLLVISTRTVETHRNNIMRKLGLNSQIDIIRYAFKNGLINLD